MKDTALYRTDSLDLLLLDYLLELPSTIAQMASDHAPELFNKPSHGLSKEQLIEKLQELAGSGLIEFIYNDLGDTTDNLSNAKNVLECLVQLTEKGGVAWEIGWKPDWEKYLLVEVNYDSVEAECMTIEALNVDSLKAIREELVYLSLSSTLAQMQPWRATYWKCFPSGFRLVVKLPNDSVDTLIETEPRKSMLMPKWRDEPRLDLDMQHV